ncbi:DUF6934 family protein [Dyadobacter crusticola]|uniref:DUF6934 family protein n=1 Tax=Dyadobacter crusticola TaxID=292407 RepID=UPI00068A218D|nr:hypothetical protein [Dyadobacter crusticola]
MKLPRYPVNQLNDCTFKFYSKGPRGRFELRVIFTRELYEGHHELYNLAFGCWDSDLEDIDDKIELKNKDADKVLSTVANITFHFLKQNPAAFVFAQGSTPSRTRKYQMGIAKYLKDLPTNFRIEGLKQDDNPAVETHWADFEIGTNYQAFILYSRV